MGLERDDSLGMLEASAQVLQKWKVYAAHLKRWLDHLLLPLPRLSGFVQVLPLLLCLSVQGYVKARCSVFGAEEWNKSLFVKHW